MPELLAQFCAGRKSHIACGGVRDLMPMSEVFGRMVKNIDERYHKGADYEFYCPENANWMSYGWIGGLINTYPMLALGDDIHLERVAKTFDFALPRAKGRSGYYYDTLNEDGNVLNRDAARNVQGHRPRAQECRRALLDGQAVRAAQGAGARRCRPRRLGA